MLLLDQTTEVSEIHKPGEGRLLLRDDDVSWIRNEAFDKLCFKLIDELCHVSLRSFTGFRFTVPKVVSFELKSLFQSVQLRVKSRQVLVKVTTEAPIDVLPCDQVGLDEQAYLLDLALDIFTLLNDLLF